MRLFWIQASILLGVVAVAGSSEEKLRALPDNPKIRCGVERWDVKVGTDDGAGFVKIDPLSQTIQGMCALKGPPSTALEEKGEYSKSRFAPVEFHTFEITAKLKEARLEKDSDYHLILEENIQNTPNDPSERVQTKKITMIAEIPLPACAKSDGGTDSPFLVDIENARVEFESGLTERQRKSIKSRFVRIDRNVKIRGVGFFDRPHDQRGRAENGIELHPVLSIEFLDEPKSR